MLSDPVRVFLSELRFAVLATVGADGTPQQTVMWYELRDNAIMMNTAEGRVKATNLRRHARVSICVEDRYRYVTIYGRAQLIDDQEQAQADIAALAIRYHGREKARATIESFRAQTRITICVPIERVVSSGL